MLCTIPGIRSYKGAVLTLFAVVSFAFANAIFASFAAALEAFEPLEAFLPAFCLLCFGAIRAFGFAASAVPVGAISATVEVADADDDELDALELVGAADFVFASSMRCCFGGDLNRRPRLPMSHQDVSPCASQRMSIRRRSF